MGTEEIKWNILLLMNPRSRMLIFISMLDR
jgi:hypothetical protein